MSEPDLKNTNPNEEQIELSDEFEAIMKTLKKNRPAYNVKIVEQLVELLETKENSKAKEKVLPFFKGMKYDQLARAESEPAKKIEYVEEARKYLEDDQMRSLEGVSTAAKMSLLLFHKEDKDIREVISGLGKFSEEFQISGHERDAKWAQVIKKMYEAAVLFNTNRPEAIAILEEAEAICVEQGHADGAHKMRSLKYHLEAKFQRTPQEARKYVEKSLEEIELTSDKYGKERAEADLLFLDALVTGDPNEKAEKFLSAGKLYLADGEIKEQAYEALARGYALKAHQSEISIEEVQKYQKQAAEFYEKAGLKRMAHNLRGGYYAVRAIKRGLIGGKNKWFLKDSFEAMSEFEKAGNRREFEFLMGTIALMMAKDLPDHDKIHNLEIASKLLNQKSKGSGDFATYELFLTKANIEPNEVEQKKLRKEALKYLENFVNGLTTHLSLKKRPELEKMDEEHKPFLISLQADACRLQAIVADSLSEKKKKQEEAKGFLEELRKQYPKQALTASFNLGMLYIEMEEFDKAIGEFELGLTIGSNQQLKKALAYAQGLLKKGFREMREERTLRNEFTAFHALNVGEVPTYLEEFVPKVMKIITKRGEAFERSPKSYSKKGETELRDEMLTELNRVFPGDATAESFVGNGKTDFRIKNPVQSSDEAIGECKWWSGAKAYLGARDQLFGYLPPRQPYGLLVTFVNQKDFDAVYSSAKAVIESSPDYEQGTLRDFEAFGNKKFAFLSKHKTNKGGSVWLYHLLFNIYPGAG